MKNIVVVLCLGGSLKKINEKTFEKKFIVSFRKTFEFSVNSNIKLLSKLQKKCFKKCPVLGQRESLRDVPFLETLISAKKCKKKFLTSA